MHRRNTRWFLFLVCCLAALTLAWSALADGTEAPATAPTEETVTDIAAEETTEPEEYVSSRHATWWSLLPPIIAIGLALITKEVYSSLFVGIVAGGLIYANFNFEKAFVTIVGSEGGMIGKLADEWNMGILIFLVILGIIVVMVNYAGGSSAYGNWAARSINNKRGAGIATLGLGALIFVDDYFNCLTVGSVMLPVTDKQKISRAKLAYIIDSTAAPICIIAPISSWAAAVVGVVDGYDGLSLFVNAIPYNFYALLTVVMVLFLCLTGLDFGPMRRCETAAAKGDMARGGALPENEAEEVGSKKKGKVIDLLLPVIVLIASCIVGMIYTGGFFEGTSFRESFANCDASVGLALGSLFALLFTFVYYGIRRAIPFRKMMDCIPKGFSQMVPAIMILILAWTLGGMTSLLGADVFVAELMRNSATIVKLLPALVFLVSIGLAFATGTSWGTFTILLPIVMDVLTPGSELVIITVSACLAGAVCGDHCSPISDTTIMASTGARCDHVVHVSTQLPYAMTVAAVSAISYLIAGWVQNWLVCLAIAIALMLLVLGAITLVQRMGRKSVA